jgi:hypothetical protein
MEIRTLLTLIVWGVIMLLNLAPDQAWGNSRIITDKKIEAFRQALEQDGFQVTPWTFGRVDISCLVCNGILPMGYGNNAGAPYLIITQEEGNPPNTIEVPRDIQLEPYDAVVFIGKTPPPAAYFSFSGYLFDYYDEGEPNKRKVVFSSLGDTISPHRINVRNKKLPYDQDVVIVMTPDRGTNARVWKAAHHARIPHYLMNTFVVPSSVVNLGKGDDKDRFVFLQRIFLPDDENDLETYLKDAEKWATVFYLTFPKPPALNLYPMPEVKVRGTGKTEVDLMPALDKLEAAILADHPGYQATRYQSGIWLNEWLDGIQRGVNLLGECRDTVYLKTENFRLTDNVDDFLIVYGVNHEAAKKATYSNFSIYHYGKELGIAGRHSRQLAGSADQYDLGKYQDKAKFLYAFKVARNCGGESNTKCLPVNKVPTTELCKSPLKTDCPLIDLGSDLFVAFRAYVEPKTGVGPYLYEILWDRVMQFSKP